MDHHQGGPGEVGASSVLGSYRKLAARRAESGIVVTLKAGQRNKRLQVDAEFTRNHDKEQCWREQQ